MRAALAAAALICGALFASPAEATFFRCDFSDAAPPTSLTFFVGGGGELAITYPGGAFYSYTYTTTPDGVLQFYSHHYERVAYRLDVAHLTATANVPIGHEDYLRHDTPHRMPPHRGQSRNPPAILGVLRHATCVEEAQP